jgi:hypothetical protein
VISAGEADFGRDCGHVRVLCISRCFNALTCLIFIDAQDARWFAITVAAGILPIVLPSSTIYLLGASAGCTCVRILSLWLLKMNSLARMPKMKLA